MRRITGAAGVALAGLLLVGCGAGGTEPPSGRGTESSGPTATAAPSGTATAPDPATSESPSQDLPASRGETLLTVTRTGGIAGRHDIVVVYADGTYTTLVRGRTTGTAKMRPAALTKLRDALAASGIERLPRVLYDRPAPDAFLYAISHGGDEVVMSDAEPVPGLRRVIAATPLPS
ncbi:hypothetical protein ACFVWX_12370 [Streptomyces sp. NPDC058220]|uniref:hypothetical protein n=1 Tax=Streptomyces sp. NPDC058220 TaxID=3346387 RepID=UPI0036E8CAC7